MRADPISDDSEQDDDRLPAEEALPNLRLHPLDDEDDWDFAFVMIRLKSRQGSDPGWAYRTSSAPNRTELLGALQMQVDLLRRELLAEWGTE
ncbi:hypothetical protein GCM10009774_33160 [Cellulomonas gelida]|uniref:Uncharacterized protein n=1 Tax=Cellulomonas gelida TaxID=1712 RepID=A0A4Y3KLF3_9CELL|nr:hypothetical protein CGE01nite_20930 [Cellulomonas gelida]GGL39832.1 hypothetical protein GCM10009774_33160 [Cellulomonas gelida]